MDSLAEAVAEYIGRRDWTCHPDGRTDKSQRWYPDDRERQACCTKVRGPSRSWPWSLERHCRTMRHVAHLFGVEESDLRQAVYRTEHPSAKPVQTRTGEKGGGLRGILNKLGKEEAYAGTGNN